MASGAGGPYPRELRGQNGKRNDSNYESGTIIGGWSLTLTNLALWYNANRRLIMEKEQPQNIEDLKREIVAEIANLSRLLGAMPNDDVVSDARSSFLRLSLLINEALDLKLP